MDSRIDPDQNCDYCLALNETLDLHKEVKSLFDLECGVQKKKNFPKSKICEGKIPKYVSKTSGGSEELKVRVLPANLLRKPTLQGWDGLGDGILVEATTVCTNTETGESSIAKEYFISSLDSQSPNIAQDVMTIIGDYLGIKTTHNRVLNTTFLQPQLRSTNADYLVGREFISKFADNWLASLQLDDSDIPMFRVFAKLRKARGRNIK